MGTNTAPVVVNAKLCRFHRKCDIFFVSVTISEIWGYVSASVAGCWGSVSGPKWRIAILTFKNNKFQCIYMTNFSKMCDLNVDLHVCPCRLCHGIGSGQFLIMRSLITGRFHSCHLENPQCSQ